MDGERAVDVAVAESGEPVPTLHRIAAQRRELDRAELVAVRRARNAGASWALIAAALGVSRQAAHHRYGR